MATYQVIVQGGNQLDEANPPLALEETASLRPVFVRYIQI